MQLQEILDNYRFDLSFDWREHISTEELLEERSELPEDNSDQYVIDRQLLDLMLAY